MKTINPLTGCRYIISEFRPGTNLTWYVAARPAYYRKQDGSIACDGCFKGGPEWTLARAHAFEFTSYWSAARVQGKCPNSRVHPIIPQEETP